MTTFFGFVQVGYVLIQIIQCCIDRMEVKMVCIEGAS